MGYEEMGITGELCLQQSTLTAAHKRELNSYLETARNLGLTALKLKIFCPATERNNV